MKKYSYPERNICVLHLASCDEFFVVMLDHYFEEVYVIWFNAGTTMILYEAAILLLIQCGPVLKSVVFF